MTIPKLYKSYFIDKDDERRELFLKVSKQYSPKRGLYSGSFVHITPSFYIPSMVYIDSDRRVGKFFLEKELLEYIKKSREYSEEPEVKGLQMDFRSELPLEKESFDIIFSFYSGFISRECKDYLKVGGILICNNSHGDSSLAYLDSDYELIGVIRRYSNNFTISSSNLTDYFHKKDGSEIDQDKVLKTMIGEKFTKVAFAYIFRRIS